MHAMQVSPMNEAPGMSQHRDIFAKTVLIPETALTTQDTAGNKHPGLNPCYRQKICLRHQPSHWSFSDFQVSSSVICFYFLVKSM